MADTLPSTPTSRAGVVGAEEWQDFLPTGITPGFPQGITSWRGSDRWRSDTGTLEHEASCVLRLVHTDTADTESGVREVMALYRARFAQEAVLRVRLPACISLK